MKKTMFFYFKLTILNCLVAHYVFEIYTQNGEKKQTN